MTTERARHPNEVYSKEFIHRHGYIPAMNGGYQEEFKAVKAVLPELSGFTNLPDFIKRIEEDSILASKVAKDLIRLWQIDYELRPGAGMILLLTLWERVAEGRKAKGFAAVCEDIFFILAGAQPYKPFSADEHTDVIAGLLKEISKGRE